MFVHVTPVSIRAVVTFVLQPFASHSPAQALKKLSVPELCMLMQELNLNACVRAFEEEELDGEGLLELSREEFTAILTEAGAISNAHYASL